MNPTWAGKSTIDGFVPALKLHFSQVFSHEKATFHDSVSGISREPWICGPKGWGYTLERSTMAMLVIARGHTIPYQTIQYHTGVGNCPILGILDITWKSSHGIDHIPILVGWCSMGTFHDPCGWWMKSQIFKGHWMELNGIGGRKKNLDLA